MVGFKITSAVCLPSSVDAASTDSCFGVSYTTATTVKNTAIASLQPHLASEGRISTVLELHVAPAITCIGLGLNLELRKELNDLDVAS